MKCVWKFWRKEKNGFGEDHLLNEILNEFTNCELSIYFVGYIVCFISSNQEDEKRQKEDEKRRDELKKSRRKEMKAEERKRKADLMKEPGISF